MLDAMESSALYVEKEEKSMAVNPFERLQRDMFVNTQSGMVYTYREIKEDLESAGLTNVTHAVDVPSMAAVVTAKKPGS